MAACTIKHNMLFSIHESDEWKLFTHHAPIKNSGFPRKEMILKPMLEQFLCVKNEVNKEFLDVKGYDVCITFTCLTVDFHKKHHSE